MCCSQLQLVQVVVQVLVQVLVLMMTWIASNNLTTRFQSRADTSIIIIIITIMRSYNSSSVSGMRFVPFCSRLGVQMLMLTVMMTKMRMRITMLCRCIVALGPSSSWLRPCCSPTHTWCSAFTLHIHLHLHMHLHPMHQHHQHYDQIGVRKLAVCWANYNLLVCVCT